DGVAARVADHAHRAHRLPGRAVAVAGFPGAVSAARSGSGAAPVSAVRAGSGAAPVSVARAGRAAGAGRGSYGHGDRDQAGLDELVVLGPLLGGVEEGETGRAAGGG